MATLSVSFSSLVNSLASIVENWVPAGIPAITRNILETYAKLHELFLVYPDFEKCLTVIKQEAEYEISQDLRTLRAALDTANKETSNEQDRFLVDICCAISQDVRLFWGKENPDLVYEKDPATFHNKVKILTNTFRKSRIQESVTAALLGMETYQKHNESTQPLRVIYSLLCSSSHANIGAVNDQVLEEKSIYSDLVPNNTELYIEVVHWCTAELVSKWESVPHGAEVFCKCAREI